VYELAQHELQLAAEAESADPLRCATFGASPGAAPQLAAGSFGGRLKVWDLEVVGSGRRGAPLFDTQAHASLVNAIDGFGGRTPDYGPPEIATAGRDGAVRLWDVRQPDAPVAAFEPAEAGGARCGASRRTGQPLGSGPAAASQRRAVQSWPDGPARSSTQQWRGPRCNLSMARRGAGLTCLASG
jgi:hypothetical protein